MTDIEQRITGFLHDEADNAALPNEMFQRVLRRAGIRRLVTATIAGVAMIAIIMAGVMIAGEPRSPSNVTPAGPEELPVPPDSLREQVPYELRRWIESGLVLLYTDGGAYHLFHERAIQYACSVRGQNPEACLSTARHVIHLPGTKRDRVTENNPHELGLPKLPEGAELLWRGLPAEGSIGIRSPGACERIERFERYCECRDGVPVYLREVTNTDEGPILLRPGRNARREAKAATRRWVRTQELNLQGTSFGVRVEPAAGSPQGGCHSRNPHRKQTWRRTWAAYLGWEDRGIEGIPRSAHLVHIGVFLGRTPRGWEVYWPNAIVGSGVSSAP